MNKINLGDTVVDTICGLKGVVTSRTVYLNGCVQYGVQPKYKQGQPFPDEIGIDEQHLKVIKSKEKEPGKEPLGGAYRQVMKMRGY